ncbi:MAG: hypothetical protein ACOX9R_10380 [Armatimonadota bacterium]|jgi:hypothetical protein
MSSGAYHIRLLRSIALPVMITVAVQAAADLPMRFIDEEAEGEYSVLCPIVIDGPGELCVAFDVRDGGEMSWVRIADGVATLHRVAGSAQERVGGAARVEAVGPAQLTIQRRDGRVRVVVAGTVALDEPWDGPSGGDAGVMSTGGHVASKPMIQPVDAPFMTDDFTRETDSMGNWETAGGRFENTMVSAPGAQAELSANPFSLHVRTEDQAVATTGYWFWDSYRVTLNVRPIGAESVALRAWVQDEANFLALRWAAGGPDEPAARRLVLVRDGVEQRLAEAPGGFAPGEWYRLELRVTPGHVEALIDRSPVFAVESDALGQGAVGLALAEGDAYFDDLFVAPPEQPDPWPPRINPVFLTDEVMSSEELFLPRSFWARGPAAGEFWHWGEFFDDAVVTVPAELLAGDGLGVLLRSDGDEAAGYLVDVGVTDGSLVVSVARNGVPVASGTASPADDEPLLITVAGDTVEARHAGRSIVQHTDPQPLSGRRVALFEAPRAAADLVTVFSRQFRDYVFDTSPTDWFAGKGQWGVTTRWPCEPGWTFYGGVGAENPLAWTKHTYRGDVVLEWFGAIQSDNVNRIRYQRPSDINATICGDGQSLSSGYSFILGGWNNTRSAILRNGEVVAEAEEVVLPDLNARDLTAHRGWSRLRAEKFGDQIRMWYNGEVILEYTDPDPLPEGRIGLWSFHNEPVAGRVRLWYEHEGPPSVVRKPQPRVTELVPIERPAEATEIFNDFEADCGEWQALEGGTEVLLELDTQSAAGGRSSLRITNQEEGGPFAVAAVNTPFTIDEWPVLSFDYRLPPDVRVNLYLLINRRWHAVTLAEEQAPWDDVPVIGRVADLRADGEWHHARVDLLAGLNDAGPLRSTSRVTQVVFSPAWESYARCGIGGNARGATYWIDNFRIGPAE